MQNSLFLSSRSLLFKLYPYKRSTNVTTASQLSSLRALHHSRSVSSSPVHVFRHRSSSLCQSHFPATFNTYYQSLSTSTKSSASDSSSHALNEITSHRVVIDGQPIHYEKSGHGSHVLLLLPGAIGTGRTDFLPQLTGLNPDLFTMIAWDPPGYGQSRPPERDFNDFYRKDAEMAAKLMQTLNYHRYSVLGWSDGGITGLILAANQGNPCVQKLIIWGSNAYVNEEDRACVIKVRNPKTDWHPSFRQTFIDIYGEDYFTRLWDRFVAHYITLGDICKSDLKHIQCPVLILHGDLDPMLAAEHPVYLVNNIDNATLYRFPKGKHNIHQKYADEFNKLVEDFLC